MKSHLLKLSICLLTLAIVAHVRAQVGSDNPYGPAGVFNGQITTGCSYDAYTGNAQRVVTDLVVHGAVGEYPLAFTRTANSRNAATTPVYGGFGGAAGWLYSYQWSINSFQRTKAQEKIGHAKSYTINYPNGRVATFTPSANPPNDPYSRGPVGVKERLNIIWDSPTAGRVYLILPDGGQVYFQVTIDLSETYAFVLVSITDPHGLTTTVTQQTDGSILITEPAPAGRWLRVYIRSVQSPAEGNQSQPVVDHVAASDGRIVQYNYAAYTVGTNVVTTLTSVNYYSDPNLTATYTYQADYTNAVQLSTCNDPLYPGPMRKIAYTFASVRNPNGTMPPSGQILSEKYFDGTTVGAAVSTLAISTNTTRTENRGDGKTRTLTYTTTPVLTNYTDFKTSNRSTATLAYGLGGGYSGNGLGVPTKITDFNGNLTNISINIWSLKVTQITYPQTPGDTPPNTPAGTVSYTYGSAACPDQNNRDPNNPYYLYSFTDEGGHPTVYLRDSNKRVTQINYPDGETESFQYNSFGEVTSHTLRTGGVETFTYDGRGLKQTYSDAYHSSGSPSVWYQYDSLDRLSGATDALGSGAGDVYHTTNYTYNSRDQILVTTHPIDPVDGARHTVINAIDTASGTLTSVTDELGHQTSYTYDDYRRYLSATTPPRFTGDSQNHTTSFYYDANGTANDYTHTDSNVTHIFSPSGKETVTVYDENHRKISVTAASGTSDAATTSYVYDANGNLTSVVAPNQQQGQPYFGNSTTSTFDQRSRQMSLVDSIHNTTTIKYDAAGRKASVTRANGQLTTFDSYDAMNRLLQQTVKQTPDPDAVTKYTYYTSGLLHTMQDPHLVAIQSPDAYSYVYDQMGRKVSLTYPGSGGTEAWHYDTAGRNDTFTNRNTKVQTMTYDALNRTTGFSWNDNGLTPSVSYGYDAAFKWTSVSNANATIGRTYFNDNLFNTETTTYADNTARTLTYSYDADGDRATIQYPNGAYSFTYNYTNRNQLHTLVNNSGGGTVMTYGYDPDGNLTTRTPDNGSSSSYTYDGLDRVTHLSHTFNGNARTFDYAYDSVSNRKWAKRDGGTGDVFGYDMNDQSTSVLLNVSNPDTTSPGSQTIVYDANGNRTTFSPYGTTDTYTTNSLNQYTARNSSNAAYDNDGNMTTGLDGSGYTFDAQNRLVSATKSGNTEAFAYDGLNRQVSRTIGSASPLYNVYDGWDLIGEYNPGSTMPLNAYLNGAGGLAKLMTASSSFYYYQDASGCTSHLADNSGHLVEWYRYDLQGTPVVYDPFNIIRTGGSIFGIRHLFTGQQWYSDIGLYDLRNRFYSPDMGRFLQTDPIGHAGGNHLYRYCANNPVRWIDPMGLDDNSDAPQSRVWVEATPINGQDNTAIENVAEWSGTSGLELGGIGVGTGKDGSFADGLQEAGSRPDITSGQSVPAPTAPPTATVAPTPSPTAPPTPTPTPAQTPTASYPPCNPLLPTPPPGQYWVQNPCGPTVNITPPPDDLPEHDLEPNTNPVFFPPPEFNPPLL